MIFLLDWERLNIIGHAISWQLGGQFHRIPAPHLTEKDKTTLLRLHHSICDLIQLCLSGVQTSFIFGGDSTVIADNKLTVPNGHLRLMTQAVAAFVAELGHSQNEVEIITGAPFSKTQEILSQLQLAESKTARDSKGTQLDSD